MSREHVFPRWLAALFEDGGPVEMHRIHQPVLQTSQGSFTV
jgi:hypothetical protein